MKKNKQGYSLAEVLIALAIVGVVAALTIPSLVKNTADTSLGPSIGRAVQSVETGLANVFALAQKRAADNDTHFTNSLSALQVKNLFSGAENEDDYLADGTLLFDMTQGIMGCKKIENNGYLDDIKEYSGNTKLSSTYNDLDNTVLIFNFEKKQALVMQMSISGISEYLTNIGYKDVPQDVVIGRIFIDGNGKDAPNRLGHDVFLFGLTNSGHLVPAGSEAYNNNIFNETIPLYTEKCAGDNVQDARSCSARLVNDDWKIKYNK